MKKIIGLMAGLVGLCCNVKSQDRIYMKNGEVLSVKIDSVRNLGIYFTFENGTSKVIDPYEVSAVKYALGETLPISGRFARRNLSSSYRYQNYPSQHKGGLIYDVAHDILMVNYEYFIDQKMANAISLQIGGGLNSKGAQNKNYIPKNTFIGQLEYHYYPSLHRNVRYFIGPYTNYVQGRFTEYWTLKRRTEDYYALGVGILNGLQVKLGNLAWNTKFGIGLDTHIGGTIYFQTGLSYFIPVK